MDAPAAPVATAPAPAAACVQQGDSVLLRINGTRYVFAEAGERGAIRVGKRDRIKGKELVGARWGAEVLAQGGKLVPAPPSTDLAVEEAAEAGPQLAVTSKLVWDDNKAQALTPEDIARMKSEGKSGDAIVAALVSNSASFKNKSQFAQAKYLNKKKRKHEARLVVLRPSVAAICDALEGSPKTQGLRSDSVAALLTWSSVASGHRVLLHDPTALLAAAVLERLGGAGELVWLYSGASPPSQGLLARFNFSAAQRAPLRHVPLTAALATPRTEPLLAEPFDAVLAVATVHDPRALLPPLLDMLRPSRSCAVFCPYLAPLADCFTTMLGSGRFVRVQLGETWQRAYQVLPQRTHPTMSMHGASGFVLSAIRILPVAAPIAAATAAGATTRAPEGEAAPEAKRSKHAEEAAPGATPK